jgi:Spy/CpxP family protein refolding chaperone
MTQEAQATQATPGTQGADKTHHRRCGNRVLALVALIGLVGAGAVWAAGHAGLRPFHRFGGGPGFMKLQAEFMVDRALRAADATDEQKREVEAIVERVFAEHKALRAEGQALHEEVATALTAEKIDRARLEVLRQRHLALIEKGSRQLTQALGDAGDVLTVEQRRQLVAWLKELHE